MKNTIMVVEDNDDLRMLYEEALQLEGYKVILASNGLEALNLLKKYPHRPNVIILDLMMPVMDGWTFLEERKKDSSLAQIPIVICSASKENIPTNLKFLKKPIELDQLIDVAIQYCD